MKYIRSFDDAVIFFHEGWIADEDPGHGFVNMENFSRKLFDWFDIGKWQLETRSVLVCFPNDYFEKIQYYTCVLSIIPKLNWESGSVIRTRIKWWDQTVRNEDTQIDFSYGARQINLPLLHKQGQEKKFKAKRWTSGLRRTAAICALFAFKKALKWMQVDYVKCTRYH